MGLLGLDETHFANNLEHFRRDNLSPQRVLDAQKLVWADLGIRIGTVQKTRAENFLVIGRPFEHEGKIYSEIFNKTALAGNFRTPSLGPLHSRDETANVQQNINGVPLAWLHAGDTEAGVRAWYKGIAAEAKDGRVLFNLHWQDAWAALFHEPTHEAAPDGGIGTAPRWTFEGYCEIFADLLAKKMGVSYDKYANPEYKTFAREVQKLIDFTSPTWVAKAYFLNDQEAVGRLCPLFWEQVAGYPISPTIYNRLESPATEVPQNIDAEIKSVTQRNQKPEWYKRWVRLYGRSQLMPTVPAPVVVVGGPGAAGGPPPPPPPMGGMGGPPPPPPPIGGMGGPPPPPPPMGAKGGPSRRGATANPAPPAPPMPVAGDFTGAKPPAGWA